MATMTVEERLKALRGVKALFTSIDTQCKGALAKKADGTACRFDDIDAHSWCLWGALRKVTCPSNLTTAEMDAIQSSFLIGKATVVANDILETARSELGEYMVCSCATLNDNLDYDTIMRIIDMTIDRLRMSTMTRVMRSGS